MVVAVVGPMSLPRTLEGAYLHMLYIPTKLNNVVFTE